MASVPTYDGQVLRYNPPAPVSSHPRIYYVNGIRTPPLVHAQTAEAMALITCRPVYGVYNLTQFYGVVDFAQCVQDWASNTTGKLTEWAVVGAGKAVDAAKSAAHEIKKFFGSKEAAPTPGSLAGKFRLVPESVRVATVETWLATHNMATLSLYRELRAHRDTTQYIIAHSQGNLITSDALWAMVYSYGESSLENMRVYSLASPSPAWPLGIRGRRKVYGFKNDLVTLCDPHNWSVITKWFAGGMFGRTAGDWRRYGPNPVSQLLPGIDPHDLERNAYLLNFANSIRRDLGLPAIVLPAARVPEVKNVGKW